MLSNHLPPGLEGYIGLASAQTRLTVVLLKHHTHPPHQNRLTPLLAQATSYSYSSVNAITLHLHRIRLQSSSVPLHTCTPFARRALVAYSLDRSLRPQREVTRKRYQSAQTLVPVKIHGKPKLLTAPLRQAARREAAATLLKEVPFSISTPTRRAACLLSSRSL